MENFGISMGVYLKRSRRCTVCHAIEFRFRDNMFKKDREPESRQGIISSLEDLKAPYTCSPLSRENHKTRGQDSWLKTHLGLPSLLPHSFLSCGDIKQRPDLTGKQFESHTRSFAKRIIIIFDIRPIFQIVARPPSYVRS